MLDTNRKLLDRYLLTQTLPSFRQNLLGPNPHFYKLVAIEFFEYWVVHIDYKSH